MKVKWTPPENSTFFNPPLKLYDKDGNYIEALAYIKDACYSIVSKNDVHIYSGQYLIEEPERRMTNRELTLLMSRGG